MKRRYILLAISLVALGIAEYLKLSGLSNIAALAAMVSLLNLD